MSYSDGTPITYKFAAFAGLSAAGQSSEKIAGPAGATGRLISMVAVVTTGVTVAAGVATLRNNVTTTETYGSLTVPVLAAELSAGDLVIDDVGPGTPADTARIPADAQLELDGDGGATAGAADIYVTILWDSVGP
jgi:hypothetical protein